MNLGYLFAALTMLGAGELHAQMPRPIAGGTVREGRLSFDGRADRRVHRNHDHSAR
jgi:hypothetical protein